MVLFLKGVMRSIRSEWVDDLPGEKVDPDLVGGDGRSVPDLLDAQKRFDMFGKDPIAQKILIKEIEGWRGKDLREIIGLSETEYDNKRKKIQRWLKKLAPTVRK
jgi:hypothetical protein